MKTRKSFFRKIHIGMIAFIAALFMMPQFFVPVYGATSPSTSGSNNVADDNYKITSAGTYRFTGSTTNKNISVDCSSGVIVILDDVYINLGGGDERAALDIQDSSKVTVILEGSNYLHGGKVDDIWSTDDGYAGLRVNNSAELTILGDGELTAEGWLGRRGAAGIGGNYGDSCGKITIGDGTDSPTVTATGGGGGGGNDGAAGIGGGFDGQASNGIIINSGTVTAVGGNGAAGIGGGQAHISGSGGKVGGEGITINGGKVTAKGGSNAAGIGAGNAKGTGSGGDIENLKITGGDITAIGGSCGAGIGGGDSSDVTNLKIDQASGKTLNITATGGSNGAGIGTASDDIEHHRLMTMDIYLKGGTITATGGSGGAGIGSGGGSAKNFNIKGYGTINATGYDHSSAIGAGDGNSVGAGDGTIVIQGNSDTQRLVINGKALCTNPNQNGGNDAAVIGSADGAAGDIKISYADLTLESSMGSNGAAIGTGENSKALPYAMGDITIKHCDIEDLHAYSRPGPSIGVGEGSGADNIVIEDTVFNGGAIGGCYNGNEVFTESEIKSITIKRSDITADTDSGIKAAIGSGAYLRIGKITIEDSDVDAETNTGAAIGSGGYDHDSSADAFKWTGCECGDIIISGSTVTAVSLSNGAGIGGGWGTPSGDITIKDGSDVTASSGSGGAAIGGGHAESCGKITITDSKVKADASGAGHSAGIGSSGDDDGGALLWDSTCHSILISGSTVEAKGGEGSAAIGTAQESQFSSKAKIEITDSDVTATGGSGAAGIGAGSDSTAGIGGEAPDINILGKSRITAKGGSGGAGIGGGCSGGADNITIDLEDTVRTDDGNDWKYYVKAYGGDGAAGIGSGGIYQDSDWVSENGHDTESVTVSEGFVYAKGGNSKAENLGPGAGIGGGAHYGHLYGFKVEGGFVEAHSGKRYRYEDYAKDIGHGGGQNTRPSYKDRDFVISAGTVLGGLSDDPLDIIIDGGSVRHKTDDAETSGEKDVYQTTMKIEDAYYAPSNYSVTSYKSYDENDIFSDENGKIYLYLPKSEKNKATAEYYSSTYGTYNKYYGTTTDDGNGWLKMDGILHFKKNEEHAVNEEFVLELEDEELRGTVSFALKQESPSEECIEIIDQNNTAPGAWIRLKASDKVKYTVTATADEGFDSEMYWSAKGTYTESITKERDIITDIDDPSKLYDGEPVSDPEVTLKSGRTDAAVTYKYYDADGQYLGDGKRPVNAGEYYVQAFAAGDKYFTSAESIKLKFTIEKRQITLALTASSSGSEADVKVYAFNAVDDPGEVAVKINDNYSKTLDFVNKGDEWVAEDKFENVPADADYQITADYAGTNNYLGDTDEFTFHKNRASRTLNVNDLEAVYGDDSGILTAELSADQDNSQNRYTYEIITEYADKSFEIEGFKPTVNIEADGDEAAVTYENAGYAVVKVTVTHPSYNDAVDYAVINVNKKKLTVSSYAYEGNDKSKKVTEITYGSVKDNVKYGLEYEGFLDGDDPENSFESGSLTAVPLLEMAQAGEHKIHILKKGGAPVIIGPMIKRIPFYSRNYEPDFQLGTVNVVPATLYVDVKDAAGQYGMAEPEYSAEFGDEKGNYDLMPWDSEAEIIRSIGPEKEYFKYKPGVHENAITVDASIKNYKFEDSDGKSTISKGTLTIEKGDLSADISMPSFVYNGKVAEPEVTAVPVTAADVDADDMASPGAPEMVFYEVTSAGEKVLLDGAPKDAGDYIVEAVFEEDDFYNKASAIENFRIMKAHCDVETPKVPDIYISEGLQLSDQPLPEGWAWVDGSKKLELGYVREEAVYTPEDTRNYYSESAMIGFRVLKREAEITIMEDPSKVYDGKAVDDPDVRVVSDASDIQYEYYDVTNDTSLGSEAPVNAGRYLVTASVAETGIYKAGQSEAVEFIISKRDTALKLSAEENIDGDSAKVRMTVEVMVTDGVALDEGSEVALDVRETSGEYSGSVTAPVERIDGRNIAVFEFTRAAANHYDVRASFEETQNFNSAEIEQAFDKEQGERDIDVVIEHPEYMSEDVITVPYGTDPETMTAVPSVTGPYGDPNKDVYSFRIVAESGSDTVSLAETGQQNKRQIVFENAGTAVIEVKVSNKTFYTDAVTYVIVKVEKREAEVRSYAYEEGGDISFRPLSVQYGQVGKLKYGLNYTDELGEKGDEVLSVLDTAAVNETAGVTEEGWPVRIIKAGDMAVQKSILRNYDLTLKEGRVYVTPAPLTLTADDVNVTYGQTPEFSCTAEGLMSWDAKASVVDSVGLVAGKVYEELKPGEYDIVVKTKENVNYRIIVKTGTLIIDKADVKISAAIESKVYDGQPAAADISVVAEVPEGFDAAATSEYVITYYKVAEDGTATRLEDAPVDAGNYIAEVMVAENDYYNEAVETVSFEIMKPDQDDQDDPEGPAGPSDTDKPDDAGKTGDDFDMAFWILIMFTSAAIGAVVLGLKKRNV